MRTLKLVIWDLDDTLIWGVLAEGDEEVNPAALELMKQLEQRGILQTLATQNHPDLVPLALEKFNWFNLFVEIEADLGPKAKKVWRILETLDINPLDAIFIDEDPFERDSMAAQIPQLTTGSITDLIAYMQNETSPITKEAQRRSTMYRQQQIRAEAEETASNYEDFLRSCHIQITIRPYVSEDALRSAELLTRTHQMNLGVLPVTEAIARLSQPNQHHIMIAEMKDSYGDMGRCGIVHLTPQADEKAIIESLAISCRTRARGLSLAMLVGLLRHPQAKFQQYHCRYIANQTNMPLRMLLLGANFRPQRDSDWLILETKMLKQLQLPDWVHLEYQEG